MINKSPAARDGADREVVFQYLAEAEVGGCGAIGISHLLGGAMSVLLPLLHAAMGRLGHQLAHLVVSVDWRFLFVGVLVKGPYSMGSI